ncbi:MAG: hypothetical protein KGL26_02810 [Pseudomonadota bacterium]|nr:hypothetical protein [Pseudomonadota bacterium]
MGIVEISLRIRVPQGCKRLNRCHAIRYTQRHAGNAERGQLILPQDCEIQVLRRRQIRRRGRYGDNFTPHDFMAMTILRKGIGKNIRVAWASDRIAPQRARRRADRFSGDAARPANGAGRTAQTGLGRWRPHAADTGRRAIDDAHGRTTDASRRTADSGRQATGPHRGAAAGKPATRLCREGRECQSEDHKDGERLDWRHFVPAGSAL